MRNPWRKICLPWVRKTRRLLSRHRHERKTFGAPSHTLEGPLLPRCFRRQPRASTDSRQYAQPVRDDFGGPRFMLVGRAIRSRRADNDGSQQIYHSRTSVHRMACETRLPATVATARPHAIEAAVERAQQASVDWFIHALAARIGLTREGVHQADSKTDRGPNRSLRDIKINSDLR